MIETIAQKLRTVILLHFRLVTFRIHFRKTLKPFMFMDFGPSERDHDSQNQLFLILEYTEILGQIQEHITTLRLFFWGILEHQNLKNLKLCAPKKSRI